MEGEGLNTLVFNVQHLITCKNHIEYLTSLKTLIPKVSQNVV